MLQTMFSVPAKKVKKRGGIDKELTQFQEVIRGNIRVLQELDEQPYSDCERKQKLHVSQLESLKNVKRTIFTAVLEGKSMEEGFPYLVAVAERLGCVHWEELWMDTSTGKIGHIFLARGPGGATLYMILSEL
ncbi:hypothetical protein WG66_014367 [Moniliophthora roreri]|nr:hypothetical protein WG66_014367 [Moniliophthora roreri]